VALPQLSAAGIACAFFLYGTVIGPTFDLQLSAPALARWGASAFTLSGILVLAAFERRGRETLEARIGITYAAAGALTILFLAVDPYGEAQMVNLLKGDLLATTRTSLTALVIVFGVIVAALLAFQKEFLLVSFDRDLAVVFGKAAGLWDTALYLLCGLTIAFGVTTAGPLVTFGFLLAPPLTARLLAKRMLSLSVGSAVIGGVTSFVGFYCAYRYDLPLGPTEVAVATAVLLVVATSVGLRQALAHSHT
jgi:iron/zinc/copper transport system substrate-binding protein/iron/zinc/copper transport system permease protein